MAAVRGAVILAAGMGTRLRPITETMPKCMTEVNGRPILLNALSAMNRYGIEEVTVVVGYCGRAIIDAVGERFGGISVNYLWNEIYAETNSMYSAWLARSVLEQGPLLIEGDVLFDQEVLKLALEAPEYRDRSVWLADRFGPESEGSMSISDEDGRITEVRIVRETLPEYRDNYYKSAGIVRVTADYGRRFSDWLSAEVERGNTNVFYDVVLAQHLSEAPIHVCDIGRVPWIEIDSFEDLREAEELFQSRKHLIVVMDGAADLPIAELGGRTPIEAACVPTIDLLTERGRTGLVQTMYPGAPLDGITANMGILGFDPTRYYPTGRASFEAMAQDIFLDEKDMAFRCNLISLDDECQITDFTAGQIPTDSAVRVLDRLQLGSDDLELYSGQGYRHILVLRDAGWFAQDLEAAAPHCNLGMPVSEIMLRGDGPAAQLAERLNRLMVDSISQLREISKELGTKADMLWLWSPSHCPRMPSFEKRFGVRGAIVAGLDFIRGIGVATGMHTKEIHGATGCLDTSYREKLKYAKLFLTHNDLIFLHINAPDEEGHAGNTSGKIAAIERIDREILAPLLEHVERRYPDKYRILILPGHYTCLKDAQHLDRPVPYCLSGDGIIPDGVEEFSEERIGSGEDTQIFESTWLVKMLLGDQPPVEKLDGSRRTCG